MPKLLEPQGPEPLARQMAMRESRRKGSGDFLDIMSEMASRDAESGTDVGRGMSAPVQPDRGTPAMLASMTTAGNQEGGGLVSRAKAQVMPVSGRFNLFGGMRGAPSGGQQKKGGGCYRGPNGQMICPTQQGGSQVGTPDDGIKAGGGMPIMGSQGGSSMPMMRPQAQNAPATSPGKTASPAPATPMGSIVASAQATGDDELMMLAKNFQQAYAMLNALPEGSPTYRVAAASIFAIEAGKNLNDSYKGLSDRAQQRALREQQIRANNQTNQANEDKIAADKFADEPQRIARINAATNGGVDEFTGTDYSLQTKSSRINGIVREQMELRASFLGENPELVRETMLKQRQIATASVLGHDIARDQIYSFDDNPNMPGIQGLPETGAMMQQELARKAEDRENMDVSVFAAYGNITNDTVAKDGTIIKGKPLRGEELQGYMRTHFAENLRLQFHQQIQIAYMGKDGKLPPGMTQDYISKIALDSANLYSDAYADLISNNNGVVSQQQRPAPRRGVSGISRAAQSNQDQEEQ